MLDSTKEHNGVNPWEEKGKRVKQEGVPIVRERTLLYISQIRIVRAAGYHFICCCNGIGDYLIEIRRKIVNLSTHNRFKTCWAGVKEFNLAGMSNLCALDRKKDRLEDLSAARKLIIRASNSEYSTQLFFTNQPTSFSSQSRTMEILFPKTTI